MSLLLFAVPPVAKSRPPADDATKDLVSQLVNDLQILALVSPPIFRRVAKMVHRMASTHRACLRAELKEPRDRSVHS